MAHMEWKRVIILPFFVIAACTSLSKEECQKGNWFDIGQNDGSKGRALSAFEAHAKVCKKHGIKPDRRQYEDGRLFGLARYCTPLSGFKAGRYSQTYQNVCPPESQGEFVRGYELGAQFGQVERQLSDVNSDIVEIQVFLRKDNIKADQRLRLNNQADRLGEEEIRLKKEIQRIRLVANQTL